MGKKFAPATFKWRIYTQRFCRMGLMFLSALVGKNKSMKTTRGNDLGV